MHKINSVIFLIVSAIIGAVTSIAMVYISGCNSALAQHLLVGGIIGFFISLAIFGCHYIIALIYNSKVKMFDSYIVTIDVSYSIDGKKFDSNIYSVPIGCNFYLKLSFLIKTKKNIEWFFNKEATLSVNYPEQFRINNKGKNINYKCLLDAYCGELSDIINIKSETDFSKYKVMVTDSNNQEHKYIVCISDNAYKNLQFKISAATKPKTYEVLFKINDIIDNQKNIGSNESASECCFCIYFSDKKQVVYSKQFRVGFIDCYGEII
jgi:hypothetical protein